MLAELILVSLAAYGFSTGFQMLRKGRLDFKPFNCKFCLSFWFGVLYAIFCFVVSWKTGNLEKLEKLVILPFAVCGLNYVLITIEKRLEQVPINIG